jgi:mannose/fructose/N-acetylgalactosamine-specific phosphotransferase system component IIC
VVLKAILVALCAYFAGSTWAFGIGFSVFNRPLILGTLIGLIMGDPIKGMIVGATINVIYLGWISAGGSAPADIGFAGAIGTAAALTGNLTPEQALAVAVPVGLLGSYASTAMMTLASFFPHWADRYAEEGNTRGVALVNMLPKEILNFPLRTIPVFLVVMYGGNAVAGILAALPKGAITGLSVAGKMLPAVGVAMLLMYMGRAKLMVFYFIGFVMAAYASKNLMLAGILGSIMAVLYIQLTSKDKEVV